MTPRAQDGKRPASGARVESPGRAVPGRRLALAALLAAVAAAGAAPVRAATQNDAWAALAAARAGFEHAAWTADFVQTWVPAGFASGERESGTVSLALPGSLRWDYAAPFPKSLLVRLDTAYSWNPGESSGRRVFLEPDERQHLALLALDLAALRQRFSATLEPSSGAGLEILLVPLAPADAAGQSEIREARLALDARSHRLLRVAYADAEGNRTEFELSGHRPAAGDGLFTPPAGLEWLDD